MLQILSDVSCNLATQLRKLVTKLYYIRWVHTAFLVGGYTVSELIMDIAISDKCWSKGNVEQCFIMTQRHTIHIMENKVHYLAMNLDGFMQYSMLNFPLSNLCNLTDIVFIA